MTCVRKEGVKIAEVDSYVPGRGTETKIASQKPAGCHEAMQIPTKRSKRKTKILLTHPNITCLWRNPFQLTLCKNCGIPVNIQNISRGFRKESVLTCGLIPVKSFYPHLLQSPERTAVAGG